MDGLETDALISRARDGDSGAFEMLIERHYATIFRIAFRWSANKDDAEDITQEACVKMARGIAAFRGDSAFSTWLYRLVVNTAKDWTRRQLRTPYQVELDDTMLERHGDPSRPEEQLYALQVLAKVHALPDKERDAILLVFGEGLSHREAAAVAGCAETTISGRIHTARQRLATQLKEHEEQGHG
jgi:RNA polymerase sigma-70 factor, ECF subfamily